METRGEKAAEIRVVFGLGNPGAKYRDTRHNVGRMVVERLAERHGAVFRRKWRLAADLCEAELAGRPVRLVRSRTFMNESGKAAAALRRAQGLRPEELLVILDDADLPLGAVRLRPRGGSGGHRGLRSILQVWGGEEVPRLRIGIGRDPRGGDLIRHVLSSFAPEERESVREAIERAADAVETVVAEGIEAAMNRYNG